MSKQSSKFIVHTLVVLSLSVSSVYADTFDSDYICVVNDAQVYYDLGLNQPAPSLTYWTPLKMVHSALIGEALCFQTADGTRLYCEHDADYNLFGKSYAIIATSLNLRSGPGISYEILTRLNRGTVVAKTGDNNEAEEADGYNWIKVCLFDGTIGWLTDEYLIDHKAWVLFSDLDELALCGDMSSLEDELKDRVNKALTNIKYSYQEKEIKYYPSTNGKYIIYVNFFEYDGLVVFGDGEGLCGGFYFYTPEEVMWSPDSKCYMIYRPTAGYTPGGLCLYQAENNHQLLSEYIGNTTDNSLPRFYFHDSELFLWVDYSYSYQCLPCVWAYDMRDNRKILLLEPNLDSYRALDDTKTEWEVQLVLSEEVEKKKEKFKSLLNSDFFKLYYMKWILCGWSEA